MYAPIFSQCVTPKISLRLVRKINGKVLVGLVNKIFWNGHWPEIIVVLYVRQKQTWFGWAQVHYYTLVTLSSLVNIVGLINKYNYFHYFQGHCTFFTEKVLNKLEIAFSMGYN